MTAYSTAVGPAFTFVFSFIFISFFVLFVRYLLSRAERVSWFGAIVTCL